MNLNIDKKKSPVNQKSPGSLSHQESKSPGSYSQKSAGVSRQGTVRASPHRRKNSASLNLGQSTSGRRSPSTYLYDRSPQGHRSPNLMLHDQLRSPSGSLNDRRSPQGRKSPIGFSQGINTTISISPTDRKSPIASGSAFYERKSPTNTIQVQNKRSSIGFSQSLLQTFPSSSDKEKKSPIQIPPITISNPTESYELSQRMMLSQKSDRPTTSQAKDSPSNQEKKEKPSVMREILAFVRKPSKKVSTRTSKFAAAFSRRESDSGSPLLRQSTFSSIPNASSRTARAAVTKQMSDIGFEPKMSLKFKNVGSKVAQRLRRGDKKDQSALQGQQQKKSSGDDISDLESQSSDGGKIERAGRTSIKIKTDAPFELGNVHFEKVGEAYSSKHDQIEEEQTIGSPVKAAIRSDSLLTTLEPKVQTLVNELKKSLEPIFGNLKDTVESIDADETNVIKTVHVQCPTFEIEPPSRRASFDPPRSPFLENLRSFSDTDHSRFDSGGESFELVDTDKHNRESSFEDRHSSMDTSFDISKYQSTSYEDQNSSFELVEIENNTQRTNRDFDLRKSSIELVDADTFQKVRHDGRKSSLETHFDLVDNYKLATPSTSISGNQKNPFVSTKTKKQLSEPGKLKDYHNTSSVANMKSSHFSSQFRSSRSPLSNQTSSNYSSRDSYDSGDPCSYTDSKSPYSDSSRQHFQLPRKSPNENRTFLCTDKRCASIFEPRPQVTQHHHYQQRNSTISPSPHCLGLQDANYSSGSEFEPPSPRRAASASPKHTFTFRIVLKKNLRRSPKVAMSFHKDPIL